MDLKHERYKVESQSQPGKFYDVSVLDGKWKCTCPYHIHGRRRHCKHIVAIQMLITGDSRQDNKKTENMIISDPAVTCTRCHKTDCDYRETRHNKHGPSKRYICRNYNKKFTHRPGFLGKHYTDEAIAGVLSDVATNVSQEQAAKRATIDGRKPVDSTVGR